MSEILKHNNHSEWDKDQQRRWQSRSMLVLAGLFVFVASEITSKTTNVEIDPHTPNSDKATTQKSGEMPSQQLMISAQDIEDVSDLKPLYRQPIDRYSSEQAITELQNDLVILNYLNLADGIWGPDTEQALEHFQEDRGLYPSGLAYPATTLIALQRASDKEMQRLEQEYGAIRAAMVSAFSEDVGRIEEQGCNNCGDQVRYILRPDLFAKGEVGQSAPISRWSSWCALYLTRKSNAVAENLFDITINAKESFDPTLPIEGVMEQAIAHNAFFPVNSSYTPLPGDYIIFDTGSWYAPWRGHGGIVSKVHRHREVSVIEGNAIHPHYIEAGIDRRRWDPRYPDGVYQHHYDEERLKSDNVVGFISLTKMVDQRLQGLTLADLNDGSIVPPEKLTPVADSDYAIQAVLSASRLER